MLVAARVDIDYGAPLYAHVVAAAAAAAITLDVCFIASQASPAIAVAATTVSIALAWHLTCSKPLL